MTKLLKMLSVYYIFISVLFVAALAQNISVAKCCPEGYLVILRNRTCLEPHTKSMAPYLFSCNVLRPIRGNFTINEAGEMTFTILKPITTAPDTFCLGNNTDLVKDVNLTRVREVPMLCTDQKEYTAAPVLSYSLIASSVFLAITTIIYAVLPELRRDLQGMSLLNFCISFTMATATLAILRLVSSYSDMTLCAVRGFVAYFFLMVSFFWTNAIAIQVLRSVRGTTSNCSDGWKEFRWYALYAWGSGTVLTVCMAIVNFHPGDHEKPRIGLNTCWFYDERQQWYYMYSVMTILLGANICIFIYASTLIWRHSFASSNIKALKYKFVMSTRLIILMGLPWIFEMIITAVEENIFWTILNVFNSLQGLLIFLVLVVFRKRAVRAMHARGWLACASGPVERYLARAADDEELAVHHTEVPMDDRNGNGVK